MWSIFDIIVFVAGFAACWLSRDWFITFYGRTVNFIKRLEAKAKAIKETL